ncbi:Uma2 family endonuclease [Ktedonosporobacter rubrisoli]|uniref:Uma2 family endonuclease n=2 Tax=Ktedonosporobacter rubrisoli TaxID=2509675 RepID=A0A4P6K5K5_KTERU|nr:Uma2 family endonuclease [Ktedonosporobacter rubrisoli]
MTTEESLSVVVPANRMPGPAQGQWTYAQYATIPEDGHRYEVVSGVLYMAPSPSAEHQSIVGEIFAYLRSAIQATKRGRVFVAPFDVILADRHVVQPDVLVVLNEHRERITERCVLGAPDLVVEVASPATIRHDLHEKFVAYASAGVPEYWIVLPGSKTVELLVLEEGQYHSLGVFRGKASLPSKIVPEWNVKVEQFFL